MASQPLLNQLGKALDLPRGGLDLEQGCLIELEHDVKMELSWSPNEGHLYVCAGLGIVQKNEKGSLFRTLLAANLDTPQLEGARFALDAPEGEVLMCGTIMIEKRNTAVVLEDLSRMVQVVRQWRKHLRNKKWLTS